MNILPLLSYRSIYHMVYIRLRGLYIKSRIEWQVAGGEWKENEQEN